MATVDDTHRRPRYPPAPRLLAAQVRYQLRLLIRSPIASFATLVIPLMVLLAVNLLYSGTRLRSRGNIPFAQFFTPAMVAFAVVNACYMAVISSTTLARDQGILKRIRSTPLPPSVYMAGRIVSAGLVASIATVVVIAVGTGVYGFDLVWGAVPAAILTLAVAMFCFCALGLAVTALVPAADSALPIAWGTILPLCFISDVFQPIDNAPHWLRTIAAFFPLQPFADDLERLFNPLAGSASVSWPHLRVLIVWGVVGAAFALLRFRWEPSATSDRRTDSRRPAAFSLDRLHQVVPARGERAVSRRPRERRAERRVGEPRGKAGGTPRETAITERIEGPAPTEDSSVPPDPLRPPHRHAA
jgi:ABC-2 type transport system permease protein